MKFIRLAFTVIVLLLVNDTIFCQSYSFFDELEKNVPGDGKIIIVQDKSIEAAFEHFQAEQSKQNGIDGFRIRIFSDSGPNAKSEFDEAKARFMNVFNDVTVYESFIYPHYKLYVGDFRNKSEALKMLHQIDRYFPNVAFIVPSKINFPKLQTE